MLVNIGNQDSGRNGAQISKWESQQAYNIPVAAKSASTPLPILRDIAMNGRGSDVAKVAANPSATPKLLDDIFNDKPTFEIRKRLASNPNTPKHILAVLQDRGAFGGVLLSDRVSKNPNRP